MNGSAHYAQSTLLTTFSKMTAKSEHYIFDRSVENEALDWIQARARAPAHKERQPGRQTRTELGRFVHGCVGVGGRGGGGTTVAVQHWCAVQENTDHNGANTLQKNLKLKCKYLGGAAPVLRCTCFEYRLPCPHENVAQCFGQCPHMQFTCFVFTAWVVGPVLWSRRMRLAVFMPAHGSISGRRTKKVGA